MRDPPAMPSGALDERLMAPHAADIEAASRQCQLGAPRGFGGVATVAYALISVVNAAFGALCFLMFGEETKGMVLDNLDKHAPGTAAIKLLLCVDLLFTIPMILAAGREVCRTHGGRRAMPATCCGEALRSQAPCMQGPMHARPRRLQLALRRRAHVSAPLTCSGAPPGAADCRGRGDGDALRRAAQGAHADDGPYVTYVISLHFLHTTLQTTLHPSQVLTQTTVRLAIVAIIFGVAAGIPNFGDVVSLIGEGVDCYAGCCPGCY